MQPSGATSRQTCAALRQPRRVEAPTDPDIRSHVESNSSGAKATNFNGPCRLQVARICAVFSDGTMIADEHQPPAASRRNNPSSCLKRSLCQICTLLQPQEGWGHSNPFFEPVNWHVQSMQRYGGCHASRMHAGSVKP